MRGRDDVEDDAGRVVGQRAFGDAVALGVGDFDGFDDGGDGFGRVLEVLEAERADLLEAEGGPDAVGRDDVPLVLAARHKALEEAGGYAYPAHQTPWQEIQRGIVSQLSTGAVLEPAISYQRLAQGGIDGKSDPVPRDNH